MNFNEVMLKRRSVRKFTPEMVSESDINQLLHYAMSGPSACNKRCWEFYVVTNAEKRAQLRQASRFGDHDSPVILVVCGNTKKALPLQLNEFWIQDCSAASENILLGATDLGLGACWIGVWPMKRTVSHVQKILELPEHILPLCLIQLGHPAETPEARDQYDVKKVHFLP